MKVSDVLRLLQQDGWFLAAQRGSAVALKQEGRRGNGGTAGSEEARRQAELTRLREVIAEITAENLELKKKI